MLSPPSSPPFFGRHSEGRATLLSAQAERSVVLVAPSGYGKSALLAELDETFAELAFTLVS